MDLIAVIGFLVLLIAIVVAAIRGEYRGGTAWFLTLFGIVAAQSLGSLAIFGF